MLGRRAGREWVTLAGEERKNDALGRSVVQSSVFGIGAAPPGQAHVKPKKKGAFHQDAVDGGRRGGVRTSRATVRKLC